MDFVRLPDPYAILNRIRGTGPVQRAKLSGIDIWIVTGYDEVVAGLTDPRMSNDARHARAVLPASAADQDDNVLSRSLLVIDPPDHTRLRGLVSKAFARRQVDALRPRMQEITDDLLDAVAPLGRADLVKSLAFPLPIAVICELLGVPLADREDFQRWSIALVMPPADPDVLSRAAEAQAALAGYFTDLIGRKRAEPQDDLLTALTLARQDDQQLSDAELVAMAILLVLAGHETTVNLIGTGTLELLRHPDQLAKLRADPALLPNAIDELVRYSGPISLGVARFTQAAVELGGVRIPAGQMVMFSVTAANRDPARFDQPDRLDVTRRQGPQLGFGHGIHFCLGAPLARLEATVAIGTLISRFGDIQLAVPVERLTWRATSLRGIAELPVTFRPRHPAQTSPSHVGWDDRQIGSGDDVGDQNGPS